MRILVTGGAGFIGSHLVQRLVSQDHPSVIVLDNLQCGYTENLRDSWNRITFVNGDIRSQKVLKQAMRGVDVVFHLAAQSNVLGAVQDPDYCFSTNVAGTFSILQEARQAGVSRIVFSSSREVYGESGNLPVPETAPLQPKNAYGASKVAGEMCCRLFAHAGLDTAILRLTNVYGPRDRGRVIPMFFEKAWRNQPLTVFGGEKVLDFVWVGFVVDALLAAGLGQPIRVPVNVGSGKGTKIIDLARRILDLTKSKSELRLAPNRAPEVTRFVADTRRARALLGVAAHRDPLFRLDRVCARIKPQKVQSIELPTAVPA